MKKIKMTINASLIIIIFTSALFAGYYERGRSYYVYKKYDKATEMFLKAAESSDLGNAYYFLGEIEKLKGNYQEAVEYYKIAITKKTINRKYLRNAYWNILILAEQRGDFDSVIKACKEMWLKTKDYGAKKKIETLINKHLWTDNNEAIAKYEEGIKLKKKGRIKESISSFNSALGIDPDFLAPKFEIGMIAYKKGELDRALDYLSDIAYRITFYAEVHLILGNIYYKKRYYQKAIEHFNQVFEFGFINKKTAYFLRVKRGSCYYNIRNYDKAVEDIDMALKYNKKSIKSLLLLSAIRIKQEEYDEALKTLNRAKEISPNNPSILYQIGSVYYKEGNKRYLSYFDRLFNIVEKKKNYSNKYNKVFIIIAKKHFKNKNYKRVIRIIDAIDVDYKKHETILIAAKAYFYLKEYDKSIDSFEKISLSSDDKFILCKAYAKSGRIEKAKALLVELINTENYLKRAKRDATLLVIIRKIEKDKSDREAREERRREEEQKREKEREKIQIEKNHIK